MGSGDGYVTALSTEKAWGPGLIFSLTEKGQTDKKSL